MSFQNDINSAMGAAARLVGAPKVTKIIKSGSELIDKGLNPPSAPAPVVNPTKPTPESGAVAQQPPENKKETEVDGIHPVYTEIHPTNDDYARMISLTQTKDNKINVHMTMQAFSTFDPSEQDYTYTDLSDVDEYVRKENMRYLKSILSTSRKWSLTNGKSGLKQNKENKSGGVNNGRQKQK